jgi:hypothetical protein
LALPVVLPRVLAAQPEDLDDMVRDWITEAWFDLP